MVQAPRLKEMAPVDSAHTDFAASFRTSHCMSITTTVSSVTIVSGEHLQPQFSPSLFASLAKLSHELYASCYVLGVEQSLSDHAAVLSNVEPLADEPTRVS